MNTFNFSKARPHYPAELATIKEIVGVLQLDGWYSFESKKDESKASKDTADVYKYKGKNKIKDDSATMDLSLEKVPMQIFDEQGYRIDDGLPKECPLMFAHGLKTLAKDRMEKRFGSVLGWKMGNTMVKAGCMEASRMAEISMLDKKEAAAELQNKYAEYQVQMRKTVDEGSQNDEVQNKYAEYQVKLLQDYKLKGLEAPHLSESWQIDSLSPKVVEVWLRVVCGIQKQHIEALKASRNDLDGQLLKIWARESDDHMALNKTKAAEDLAAVGLTLPKTMIVRKKLVEWRKHLGK